MDYETTRAFADTWGLVLLVVLFVAILVFVFRRGSTKKYKDAARIPMDAAESPAPPDQKINELKSDHPPVGPAGGPAKEGDKP